MEFSYPARKSLGPCGNDASFALGPYAGGARMFRPWRQAKGASLGRMNDARRSSMRHRPTISCAATREQAGAGRGRVDTGLPAQSSSCGLRKLNCLFRSRAASDPAEADTGSTFLFCRNFASVSIDRTIEIEMRTGLGFCGSWSSALGIDHDDLESIRSAVIVI